MFTSCAADFKTKSRNLKENNAASVTTDDSVMAQYITMVTLDAQLSGLWEISQRLQRPKKALNQTPNKGDLFSVAKRAT